MTSKESIWKITKHELEVEMMMVHTVTKISNLLILLEILGVRVPDMPLYKSAKRLNNLLERW